MYTIASPENKMLFGTGPPRYLEIFSKGKRKLLRQYVVLFITIKRMSLLGSSLSGCPSICDLLLPTYAVGQMFSNLDIRVYTSSRRTVPIEVDGEFRFSVISAIE
jgi:hypothetical protein